MRKRNVEARCTIGMQMTSFSNSRLLTRYNHPNPAGQKGALPAGRYTGRARRTNALVVGQQDSGGRTGFGWLPVAIKVSEACLRSDGLKFSRFGRLGVTKRCQTHRHQGA